MCFSLSASAKYQAIESRFNAKFREPESFEPIYHVSAFAFPKIPVILNEKADEIVMVQWGLIPHWVRDEEVAKEIRMKTPNARSETAREKPSFRDPFKKRRCLILADGFFEWHTQKDGKKFPFYIHMKNSQLFAIAGLWDEWKHDDQAVRTFTLLTTQANPLLEKIHNLKRRMPVILNEKDEKAWLDIGITPEAAQNMLKPFDADKMEAWPVSKLIVSKVLDTNVPEVLKKGNWKLEI